jgi:small Trp-rich protein
MYLLWIGLACLLLKLFEVGPVGQWSWWWVLAPLGAAAIWFEGLEKLFGRDKRKLEQLETERLRQERIAQQFQKPAGR